MTTVKGNAGQAPKVVVRENLKIANFSIAQNETRKGKKSTTWVQVTCFGNLAELAEVHVKKGSFIGVSGTFSMQSLPGSDVNALINPSITATSLEFFAAKKPVTDK